MQLPEVVSQCGVLKRPVRQSASDLHSTLQRLSEQYGLGCPAQSASVLHPSQLPAGEHLPLPTGAPWREQSASIVQCTQVLVALSHAVKELPQSVSLSQ